jgi:hypothetical protein
VVLASSVEEAVTAALVPLVVVVVVKN